jgi:hypothetical protein
MIFKKCTSLILVFLLLVSNTGMAFNMHYCGEKLVGITLKTVFQNPEKGCCGVAEKKSHCCKNKVVHFQKKTDTTTLKVFSFQSTFVYLIPQTKALFFTGSKNFKTTTLPSYSCCANAPPLFQLHHQYIFYA